MASTWNVQCIPHCWGTNVATAASLQYYAAIPHIPGKFNPPEPYFEFDRSPNPIRERTTREKFIMKDGYVDIPQEPGLGITVDKDFLMARAE